MEYQGRTQSYVKLSNQRLILGILFKKGSLSRADLAKLLNSSKPTVSKNVESLLEMNMVLEIGKANSKIGKKAILIDINPDYGYILAIDLSKDKVKMVISNLKGEWLNYKETVLNELVSIEEELENFIKFNKKVKTLIQQIVIAYPGVVRDDDTFHLVNFKRKENILQSTIKYIEEVFDKKPAIKNDINLAIIAEKEADAYKNKKNIYYISGDVGIGSGIIINDQLFEGDRNAAGEIGFIMPVGKGKDTYVTIEERIGMHALLNRYELFTDEKVNYDTLKERILSGDTVGERLYQDVVEQLSVAISSVVAILDIQTVIVVGRLFKLKVTMIDDLRERINQITPLKTNVEFGTIKDAILKGAIQIGIKKMMTSMIK